MSSQARGFLILFIAAYLDAAISLLGQLDARSNKCHYQQTTVSTFLAGIMWPVFLPLTSYIVAETPCKELKP